MTSGGRRQEEIRRAALALFTERGYPATSMGDIGARVGIRGPSLYKHVSSKQQLLVEIMTGTMRALLDAHREAVSSTEDPVLRLRRATEAHVRYHARHRLEAFVGNREIRSLDESNASVVRALRREYADGFRVLIAEGVRAGAFRVQSERLAAYAILDLGMGLSAWYREDGHLSEDRVVWQYVDFALNLVGVETG
ncbi:TetR/AcrR family transcriptional regulator [Nocardia sp. NPDC052278]|uniref:TetR/AcrR family transcriptional regulator n=1 Tax=unclassified Nocardia TaxID=2637762 RepID=UPI0036B82F0A